MLVAFVLALIVVPPPFKPTSTFASIAVVAAVARLQAATGRRFG